MNTMKSVHELLKMKNFKSLEDGEETVGVWAAVSSSIITCSSWFLLQRSVLESPTELCDPMDGDIEVFTVNNSVGFMLMFESRVDFWSEAAVSVSTSGETRL